MTNDWSRRLAAQAYAYGVPSVSARIKQEPEDFLVTEVMDVVPSGDGEHTWLWVKKVRQNTDQVARELAKFAEVKPRDVGFSGMKDFQAVTEQWFSVWKPKGQQPDWQTFEMPGVVLRTISKHSKKIKRGTHKANYFDIRLRCLQGETTQCEEKLALIEHNGVPNYFGPQRFGRQCDNMRQAEALLLEGKKIKRRNLRGLVLSAARSWLFNQVLSKRIENNTWQRLYAGEPANLHGSNSVFNALDDESQRLASMDIHPTAPLVGKGEEASMHSCYELMQLERAWLLDYQDMIEALERLGLEYRRRAIRSKVSELKWQFESDTLRLRFSLPTGQYATSVIRELVTQQEAQH